MNSDTISWIATFVDNITFVKMCRMNKNTLETLEPERVQRRYKVLLSWFPKSMHVYVPLMRVLYIGNKTGSTDYIDFVKPSDMIADIMCGRDCYRRAFINVKHCRGVLTFFQRYTDQPDYWTTGGTYPDGLYNCGGIKMDHEESWVDERLLFLKSRLNCIVE